MDFSSAIMREKGPQRRKDRSDERQSERNKPTQSQASWVFSSTWSLGHKMRVWRRKGIRHTIWEIGGKDAMIKGGI